MLKEEFGESGGGSKEGDKGRVLGRVGVGGSKERGRGGDKGRVLKREGVGGGE